ncbi:MAG: type II secretion system F family protein [Gammaproteobacteria bacterium]
MTMKRYKYYEWRGVNQLGLKEQGRQLALNSADLKNRLSNLGITAFKYQYDVKSNLFRNFSIPYVEVTALIREMVIFLSAGTPIASTLQMLGESCKNPFQKHLIYDIKSKIESGHSLSEAFQGYSEIFNEICCNLVYAGERTSTLIDMLNYVVNYREKVTSFNKKIRKALTYPLFVLCAVSIMSFGLVLFIIPKFEKLFLDAGATLPIFTKIILHLTHFAVNDFFIKLLISIILIGLGCYFFQKNSYFRKFVQKAFIKSPFLGGMLQKIVLARCFRTFSILLSSGIPLLEAIKLVRKSCGHFVYAEAFTQIETHMEDGKSLVLAMKESRIFPEKILYLLKVGEESGNMGEICSRIYEDLDEQLNHKIYLFSQLLEPIIMLILSSLVSALIIAIYLPIFRLGAVI